MSERMLDAYVGFGLAASTLARLQPDRPAVLIDPIAPADDPRTFGGWALGPHPMDAVARRSWDRLRIVTDRTIEVSLAPYRYLTFRMADWRTHVLRGLPSATFVHEAAHTIEDDAYGARVRLDGRTIEARWVFDSRFAPSSVVAGPGEVLLWQSFRGARIETEHPAFDPEIPTLMDFRGAGGPVAFGYVLPEGPRHALVERVVIGPRPVAVDLDGWLRDALGLRSWRVEVEEGGATPMTDHVFPRRTGERTLAIGIGGGRLKPSTGYGLRRMLADAEHVAASLRAHGHPFELPDDPALYREMDATLLRILRDSPEEAPRVFDALFANNPGPRVLRFLDEAASPADVLGLMASLPAPLFLRAARRR